MHAANENHMIVAISNKTKSNKNINSISLTKYIWQKEFYKARGAYLWFGF